MHATFNEQERAILRIVQNNLPDSATPYADIATTVGCSEQDVISLLCRLRDNGAIRRFGASIKHQKTGWAHNAMVAWKTDETQAEECGQKAAAHSHISHCYYRPSPTADWPYTLYTMIHGRSAEECLTVINEVREATGLTDYTVLESLKEMKKTSMTYF